MKWKFCLMATVLLMAALLCFPVRAETSGTCGDNLTWTLDDEGTLTISGTGKMYDYTETAIQGKSVSTSPWVDAPVQIVIDKGVTSIGSYAFGFCRNLTSVSIPDSVISIGSSAFGYCSSLTGIIIPKGVKNIDMHAFKLCTSLTNIILPNSVTSIGKYAFSNHNFGVF